MNLPRRPIAQCSGSVRCVSNMTVTHTPASWRNLCGYRCLPGAAPATWRRHWSIIRVACDFSVHCILIDYSHLPDASLQQPSRDTHSNPQSPTVYWAVVVWHTHSDIKSYCFALPVWEVIRCCHSHFTAGGRRAHLCRHVASVSLCLSRVLSCGSKW